MEQHVNGVNVCKKNKMKERGAFARGQQNGSPTVSVALEPVNVSLRGRREFRLREEGRQEGEGAHPLSAWLSVSAQVMISRFSGSIPHWALC